MSKSHPVFVDLISVISALIIAYLLSDYSKLKENISIQANLLNNTRFSNQSVVVFNRVPKCGSMFLTTLCYKLGTKNKFKVESPYEAGEKPQKTPTQQQKFVKEMYCME